MISLNLDAAFLREIDMFVKKNNYQNRTEFIRESLRERLKEAHLQDALRQLVGLQGTGRNITEEEYERNRESAAKEIMKKLK